MINWVFDVDGVLSNVGTPAPVAFKQWFAEWSVGKRYYLITGGQRHKTLYQVGDAIVDGASAVFCCMGNSVWRNGIETKINPIELTDTESQWFDTVTALSHFPIKAGRHVELRAGSINYSVVGRNANIEQREKYKKWDTETQERQRIMTEFQKQFPRFESYIGGDTSIDICLKGANKGQCVSVIRTESPGPIYFFADKAHPGGIDEPFALRCTESDDRVFDVKGYADTWNILESLSKMDPCPILQS